MIPNLKEISYGELVKLLEKENKICHKHNLSSTESRDEIINEMDNRTSQTWKLKEKNNFYIKINSNKKNKSERLNFIKKIPDSKIKITFFDPQYRNILDKMNYGNEGKIKEKNRCNLTQMSEEIIANFIKEIERCLMPSGYLFLWIDKFSICEGINNFLKYSSLKKVDLIVWNKEKMGMGYRTRNQAEFLIILQKKPIKAKTTWKIKNIRNIWNEKINNREHVHQKPYNLIKSLINSTTNKSDYVLDPASGSYKVLEACQELERNFIGCDLI